MELHYGHCCELALADEPLFDIQEMVDKALRNVYANNLKGKVDPNLWNIAYKELNKAVEQSLGAVAYVDADWALKEALMQNNAVFAAFKSHQQYNELKALIFDADGKMKSFAAFKRDSKAVIGKYNQQWLQTEYNTTVARARTAQQWQEFQRSSIENIRWIPSRAAEPDPIHRGYWNTVLPKNHEFWIKNFPGNRYNCKCDWELTNDEVTKLPEVDIRPQAGLKENPGMSQKIFGKDHPYEASASKKMKQEVPKEATRLERKLIQEWAKQQLKGKLYDLNGGKAQLHMSGIKEILNQPHQDYSLKNRVLFALDEIVKEAEFIRTDLNTKDNPLVKQFHYYKIKVAGKDAFLVVRELANGEQQIYSIVDKLQ